MVQSIMAEDDGTYISAQSIYMMNKHGHVLGARLGQSGRQGGTISKEMSHYSHAFRLGYKPTVENWQRKGDELRERLKAKRNRRRYELVHKPIWGTLNGHFVCQGEDFPFCGFPEPWYDWETNMR